MTKAEVWSLFNDILQYYPYFSGDDDKANAWHKALGKLPYELAKENLVCHTVRHNFPPTIAELRAGFIGPESAVPSAEETRKRLAEMDDWRAKAVPMPDQFRKELDRIVRRD